MNNDEEARERRRQNRLQRLGVNDFWCPLCGRPDPGAFSELHHIAQECFEPNLRYPACPYCHRRLSDMQKDHPKKVQTPPTLDERLAHFLLGLADMLELIIETLRQFAHDLIDRVGNRTAPKPEPNP